MGTSDLVRIDHEPSCGSAPFDETAAHEDQLSWGEDIEYRPGDLLSFNKPTVDNVSRGKVEDLRYDGKLLLDFSGEPIRNFPSLPLVISSKVEGWRVEAWTRSDSRMKCTDIIARIPIKWAIDPAGHRTLGPIERFASVRERASKFRIKAGLITWKNQGKDPKIEKFMDELRSPAERANNRSISRNLTSQEKGLLASLNLGMRPDRAQVRQDPQASQKHRDRVQKRAKSESAGANGGIAPPDGLQTDEDESTFDFDCRTEHPETPEEIQEIQNALQQTYSDFASYTDVPLELPDRHDSYLDQWNFLQVQLNRIWANDRAKKTEPPQLYALGTWTVSFDNWISAPRAFLTYARE